MNFKEIDGGVVAPKGFLASGAHCGMRRNKTKRDLSIILSDVLCNTACVYTKNKLQGAPIIVTKENLQNGKSQAIICNSGNANACNENGVELAKEMCKLVSKELGVNENDVIVSSTGVIGEEFSLEPIKIGIPKIKNQLTKDIIGNKHASEGILTMDLIAKTIAIEFLIDGKICKMGVIAKGSGMIHPNMATTLSFITTDVNISSQMLKKALTNSVNKTFNMLSIDGDTSCNDMASILASGLADNKEIIEENDENFNIFCKALDYITDKMAKLIATDGEGATKALIINVNGAENDESARIIAKTISTSTLVKTSMFGMDANWGRIICAVGYSDTELDIQRIGVEFVSKNGSICVCKNGYGVPYEYDIAKNILDTDEVTINVSVGDGIGTATSYGCDFSYDFIKISANYKKATKMNISNVDKADVLINALPYIQRYSNKIIVIKYGGNAMINQELKETVMDDLILLSLVGVKVILVHGGGPEINDVLKKMGKEPKFINGLRYTDEETMDIVQMVLAGKVNKDLVSLIESRRGKAIGLCGIDGGMIKVTKRQDIDLGFVGDIQEINIEPITNVLEKGYIPVISTIGIDDNGIKYNINADTAASRIASELNAENIILLTDIRGLLEDKDDEYTLIPRVNIDSVPSLIESGIVSGGMLPKVDCCVDAIKRGVSKSFIIDGRIPHSILIEMMTNEGIGTMFTK